MRTVGKAEDTSSPAKLPSLRKSALSTAANSYSGLAPRRCMESDAPALPQLRPVEVLKETFAVGQEDAETKFKKALEKRAAGHFEEAARLFTQVLSRFPALVAARLNLGVCLMSLGKLAEAASVYRRGIGLCPDPRLSVNLAICLILSNDLQEAGDQLCAASKSHIPELYPQIYELQVYVSACQQSTHSKHRASNVLLQSTEITESPLEDASEVKWSVRTKVANESRASSLSPIGRSASYVWSRGTAEPKRKHSFWKVFKSITELDGSAGPRSRRVSPLLVKARSKSPAKPISAVHTYHVPRPKKPIVEPYLTEEDEVVRKESLPAVKEGRKKVPLQRIRKKDSLLQEDLEDEEKMRQVQVDNEREELMRQKFAEVHSIVQQELSKLESSESLIEEPFLAKSISSRLTQQSLSIVRAAYSSQPLSDSGRSQLLEILSPLKFFARFNQEVRMRLLSISQYSFYRPGETIFTQGETGSVMYVIVYGSVIVKKEQEDLGGAPLTISTLYDGDSFGELSLFLTQGQRGNTARPVSCVAGEPCDLLSIPKLAFHSIIMGQVETAIETKLAFFSNLPIFAGVESVNLVPLASNIDPVTYKFNEALVAKGEQPQGAFVIFSGLCRVYSEGEKSAKASGEEFVSARVRRSPSLKPFAMGLAEYNKTKQRDWVPYPAKTIVRSRSVRPDEPVREKVPRAILQRGDLFAGRCLLQEPGPEGTASTVAPSSCTVVAESAEVAVFVLTPKHFRYMGEKLTVRHRQEAVRLKLHTAVEYDCPRDISAQEMMDDYRQWSKYKQSLVDSARRNWFVKRNAHRIGSALRDS